MTYVIAAVGFFVLMVLGWGPVLFRLAKKWEERA